MFRTAIFAISGMLLSGAADAFGEPRIDWLPQTLRLIEPGGAYGRMLRLPDGALFFVCEHSGKIWARRSSAAGANWTDAQEVAHWLEGTQLWKRHVSLSRDAGSRSIVGFAVRERRSDGDGAGDRHGERPSGRLECGWPLGAMKGWLSAGLSLWRSPDNMPTAS